MSFKALLGRGLAHTFSPMPAASSHSIPFYFPSPFLVIGFPVFKEVLKIILHKQSRPEGHFRPVSWSPPMHPPLTVRWGQGCIPVPVWSCSVATSQESPPTLTGQFPVSLLLVAWGEVWTLEPPVLTCVQASKHPLVIPFHSILICQSLQWVAISGPGPFFYSKWLYNRPKAGLVTDAPPLHNTLPFQITFPSTISLALWHW